MAGFIIGIVLGALVGGMGVYMMATRRVSLLHSYHYATTPLQDLPSIAWWSGFGLSIAGFGVILVSLSQGVRVGMLPDWLDGTPFQILGVGMLLGGIVVSIVAIVHYNGSIVS